MKQRVVLWGALGVLVAGAVGLVVANGGGGDGGDGGAPALPLSVGSGQSDGAGDARAASVAPLEFAAPTTYVPTDDLPAGGGTEPAYRLADSVDEATVHDLAAALGIEGDATEQDGTWHVASGDMALDVYEAGASWTAYRSVDAGTTASPPDAPVSDAPAADVPGDDPAPVTESEECVQRGGATECSVESSASGAAGVATGCPADPAVLCPDPRTPEPTPERPADLPSEDEARRTALDLLAAAGTDVEGADVQVADGGVQWTVTVEPRLGGLPASGLAAFVAVGAGGRIDSASGYVGPPEELGDYDLIGTRAALDRLNDGSWGYRTMSNEQGLAAEVPETTIPAGAGSGGGQPRTLPAPADEPASTATVLPAPPTPSTPSTTVVDGAAGGAGQIAPGEPTPGGPPMPAPEPVEVAVTDAEVVLVSVPSWDDTGTYLVPGYRFTAEDRFEPVVPAVTDDVLAPPPDGEPEPVPLPAPAEEPPTTGTSQPTTVPESEPQPDPAGGPTGTEVDITLWHCGIEPLEVDGQRWVADPPPFDETNAPPELTGHGTFALAPGGGSATYTDESGITVDLTPVADDWQPPPCD